MRQCPKCNIREAMERDDRWCRECRNEYHMRWYKEHREEQVNRMAEVRRANPERHHRYALTYNERHPGRREEQWKASWVRNRQRFNEGARRRYKENPTKAIEYQKQWRLDHLESCLNRGRAYYWKNRDKRIAFMKNRRKQRLFYERSRKFNERYGYHGEPITSIQLWGLYKRQRGICFLTGRKLEPRKHNGVALDHIMPVCKGGKTEVPNLRWVCYEGNVAKGRQTDEQFMKLCLDIVGHAADKEDDRNQEIPHWAKEYKTCGVGLL